MVRWPGLTHGSLLARVCVCVQMGLVSQEPLLFNGTVADNIRIGKQDATQEELEAAAGAWGTVLHHSGAGAARHSCMTPCQVV